jgi:hypothetical protein
MIDGCVKCAKNCVYRIVHFTHVRVHLGVYYVVISEIADLSFIIAAFFFPEPALFASRIKYFELLFVL